MPEGGNALWQRAAECASGILTKKETGHDIRAPPLAIRIA